jgi:hypothetical protein
MWFVWLNICLLLANGGCNAIIWSFGEMWGYSKHWTSLLKHSLSLSLDLMRYRHPLCVSKLVNDGTYLYLWTCHLGDCWWEYEIHASDDILFYFINFSYIVYICYMPLNSLFLNNLINSQIIVLYSLHKLTS